jgi:hypothetical protein
MVVYSRGKSDQPDTGSLLRRNLYVVVAVLGVASYCVSFGPAADGGATGWHVRFAAMAGLSAAIGLLPKQTPLPVVTAVLAAMGCLDGLSSVVTAPAGWALTVIVVLNGLQAIVAIAALTLVPKAVEGTATGGYEAYLDYYNQAVQHYYREQGSAAQLDPSQHSGYGQAYGEAYGQARDGGQAPVAAHATSRSVQQSPQYSDYADLLSPQQDYGRTSASAPIEPGAAVSPPGRAGADPAQSPAPHEPRLTDESARPSWPQ